MNRTALTWPRSPCTYRTGLKAHSHRQHIKATRWKHQVERFLPFLQQVDRNGTQSIFYHRQQADPWRLRLCVCVRASKGKRLELSTPNLVHTYSMAVARRALTRRSKGQRSVSHGYENSHGRMHGSWGLLWPLCYCSRRGTARRMTARVSSVVSAMWTLL